jgi:hypothetical protein
MRRLRGGPTRGAAWAHTLGKSAYLDQIERTDEAECDTDGK